ncbi:unnamed protein product [Musa acuminata subsp. malaccensis]|uniref:(wild Malaysian banana) hypothetical protein n=1 Tax=Musa acuminata subsp. malaccensis TaxID=214687 RepID=A0A804HQI7_MUSAM|nr:PREDICTED: vesicle transport v-SNARE 13-like [Musa acuminata subsp. malaccensis]XP_018686800.1 PREDICTED: vesicle transport v-SNARE 13-like [Musa acuminata subsp. malaccensis]XP_018686811.1 PREDICTED: vesicle transport v-SNARE 13-like [Musa acuminata subsp. malaccensis]CAG1858618.1 unnamed protein product [Musa acuminata subsp. malaccensis]
MSEVFDGYERQYSEISASLSRKCTSAALLDGDSKNESRSQKLGAELKARLLAKFREYKPDIHNLKSEFKRITIPNPSQAAREELLKPGMADTLALHGGDDNISKSKRILIAISSRMDSNKWIIGGIIVALVLAIFLILYFKLGH